MLLEVKEYDEKVALKHFFAILGSAIKTWLIAFTRVEKKVNCRQ